MQSLHQAASNLLHPHQRSVSAIARFGMTASKVFSGQGAVVRGSPAHSHNPMKLSVEVKDDGKGNVLLSVVPPPAPAAGLAPKLDICVVMDV